MRTRLGIILLGLLAFASQASAQTVNNAVAEDINTNTVSATYLNPQGAGDTNIVTVRYCMDINCSITPSIGFSPAIQDTANDAYILDCVGASGGVNVAVYRASTIASPTNKITVMFTTPVFFPGVYANEQKGLWTVDGCGNKYVKGPGVVTIAPKIPVSTGDLIYGWISEGTTGIATTPGAGFTGLNATARRLDEIGISTIGAATFNYNSTITAFGVMVAYTPVVSTGPNFLPYTVNLTLLWDDSTPTVPDPVQGNVQALQLSAGIWKQITSTINLDANGAAILATQVDTNAVNAAGWITVFFSLLDPAGGGTLCKVGTPVCVQTTQSFPPQLLATLPINLPVVITLSKTNLAVVSWHFN